MLAEARQAASEAGVSIEWIKVDATQFTASRQYDAAICLCEGAFSLLSMDDDPIEHDLAILRNIHAALKPGGGLILTAVNGMRHIRRYTDEDVTNGLFDPVTLTETCTMDWDTPDGKQERLVRERGYVPTELCLLFQMVGFEVIHVGGGTAGKWGHRVPQLDEIELLAIGKKPDS